MDLRRKVEQRLLDTPEKNIVLELSTSFGKSLLALKKLKQLHDKNPNGKILIVIPRLVLKDNWIEEIHKWDYDFLLESITFVTYISFPSKVNKEWFIILMDEAHHLSERCKEALNAIHTEYRIFLSATISQTLGQYIVNKYWRSREWIKVDAMEAMKGGVLPAPKIIFYPLVLDNKIADQIYYPNKQYEKVKKKKIYPYSSRWDAKRKNEGAYGLQCTRRQYYDELSGLIDWAKEKEGAKNLWLFLCNKRLKYLSSIKTSAVKYLCDIYKGHRMIVFCNSIHESKSLRIPCINSKIGIGNLRRFNNKLINAVSAVEMLNEGINIKDCQIGIFGAINSSQILQVQKVGRLLRHKEPIIVIPYYKNTREEEIVNRWFEKYDKRLISYKTIPGYEDNKH